MHSWIFARYKFQLKFPIKHDSPLELIKLAKTWYKMLKKLALTFRFTIRDFSTKVHDRHKSGAKWVSNAILREGHSSLLGKANRRAIEQGFLSQDFYQQVLPATLQFLGCAFVRIVPNEILCIFGGTLSLSLIRAISSSNIVYFVQFLSLALYGIATFETTYSVVLLYSFSSPRTTQLDSKHK